MAQYDGGHGPADGSAWGHPVSNQKNGETHPAPAKTERNPDTGIQQRSVSPEPDPSAIVRNFGRRSN